MTTTERARDKLAEDFLRWLREEGGDASWDRYYQQVKASVPLDQMKKAIWELLEAQHIEDSNPELNGGALPERVKLADW